MDLAAAAATSLHAPLPVKLDHLEATANQIVLERTAEIRCGINALLSGRHMCMIGPPGVAKSLLTRTLVGLISGIGDGEYFEWQVTKFSTPEELFGPHSLRALEQDRYVRATANKLPEAKVAFIDEIWKASSALLNTLLPALNERIFYNNGTPTPLPLSTVFCASNETPEEATDLAALWDRIAFRLFTKPIQTESNFDLMLRMAVNRAALSPIISWSELLDAQAAVKEVVIPDDLFEAMTLLRNQLAEENIVPSERRFVECLPIIQAQAYRAGRTIADIEDMRLLSHVLWNTRAQQHVVQRLVFQLANPFDKIALEMMDDAEELAAQLADLLKNSDNKQERSRRAVEVHGKLEELSADLSKLRAQVKTEGRRSDLIEPLRERVLGLTQTLLTKVFAVPLNNLALDLSAVEETAP